MVQKSKDVGIHVGGAESAGIRKREILAGSILQMVNLHAS